MRMRLLSALVLTCCVTASAPATVQPRPADIPAPLAVAATERGHVLVASLERGPCYGRCPTYAVRVYADGSVEFVGHRFTAVLGAHTGHITPERLAALATAFEVAHFSSLKSEYVNATVTDLPYLTVSDGHKTVRHALGDEHAPAVLVTLEDAIDRAVNISQWVDGPTE